MPKERVIINFYGGRVQDVYTAADLEVVIVDWDTEGMSPSEPGIVDVPLEHGQHQLAAVCCNYPMHPLRNLPRDLATAISRGETLVGPQP